MTARTVPQPRGLQGLTVIKGRVRLPRMVVAPWLVYVVLLAVGFLGVVYSQSSLNSQAVQLSELRGRIAEAEAHSDTLRLEIANLRSPKRIALEATALGMEIPTIHLETLVAPGVHTPAETTWTTELVAASP